MNMYKRILGNLKNNHILGSKITQLGALFIFLFVLNIIIFKVELLPSMNQSKDTFKYMKKHMDIVNTSQTVIQAALEERMTLRSTQDQLNKLNKEYFNEKEKDDFARKLPLIVSSFGNKVVLLRPSLMSLEKGRTAQLVEFIQLLDMPDEAKVVEYLKNNKT